MLEKPLRPQPGPQTEFLASSADIVVFGGAAGGGKTWALLVEPLRHLDNRRFGAVTFRQTYKQIREKGGLLDQSMAVYYRLDNYSPKLDERMCLWRFNTGATIDFSYMRYDNHTKNYQGAEIPLIGWDQLEQFSEYQFFFMLSRNRSTCGIRPYVRATCNPDAGSWLAKFIQWWWDPDTGYAIPERSGAVRYFFRTPNDTISWGDSKREVYENNKAQLQFIVDKTGYDPDVFIKSFTFIKSDIYDNKVLLAKDPQYLANLLALPKIERERLLKGNWKIRAAAGKLFNRGWFKVIEREQVPIGGRIVRFWDFAATAKKISSSDPAYSAGVRIREKDGKYYIEDVYAEQKRTIEVDRDFENLSWQDASMAEQEGAEYLVRWEEEPGSSGKRVSANFVKMLAGLDAKGIRPSGDKIQRAKPLAAQVEHGEVFVVNDDWTESFLNHMHHQPEWPHNDIMDASSGGFNTLCKPKRIASSWRRR